MKLTWPILYICIQLYKNTYIWARGDACKVYTAYAYTYTYKDAILEKEFDGKQKVFLNKHTRTLACSEEHICIPYWCGYTECISSLFRNRSYTDEIPKVIYSNDRIVHPYAM